MDDAAQLPAAKRGRPSDVDAQFEEHRRTITRLWHNEGRKLANVITLMKTQHGFSASTKQYKNRLKAWGLQKNIRNSQMQHLARIKLRRDAVCKQTRFKLPDVDVDVSKIDRWVKAQKKKLGDDGFLTWIQTEAATPPEIVYDTDENSDTESQFEQPHPDGSLDDSMHVINEAARLEDCPNQPPPMIFCVTIDALLLEPMTFYYDRTGPVPDSNVILSLCGDCPSPHVNKSRIIFTVNFSRERTGVSILSQSLHSDISSLLQLNLGGVGEAFDCTALLGQSSAFKTRISELSRADHDSGPARNLLEEWSLFVDSFIGRLETPIPDEVPLETITSNLLANILWLDNVFMALDVLREPILADNSFTPDVQICPGVGLPEEKLTREVDSEAWLRRLLREPPLNPPDIIIDRGIYPENSILWTPEPSNRDRFMLREAIRVRETSFQEDTRLRLFRLAFIKQYTHLRRVIRKPSTKLNHLAEQLPHYRRAWEVGMAAMRRVSSLAMPDLLGVLCLLSIARAVSVTVEDSAGNYIAAFNQDLELWRQVFPEVEEAAGLMWGITFESIPQPQPRTTDEQHNVLVQLRDSVAVLVGRANDMLGLGGWKPQPDKSEGPSLDPCSPMQINPAPPSNDLPQSLPRVLERDKEPPDRLVCPNITSLYEETQGTPAFIVVTLATSVIFALVVYFMLGFAHSLSSVVLGLPNHWYSHKSPATEADSAEPARAVAPEPSAQLGELGLEDILDIDKLWVDLATGSFEAGISVGHSHT